MVDKYTKISKSMMVFQEEAPEHAKAWTNMIMSINKKSPLEKKTVELMRISLMAALRLHSGIPFHVISAKELGATREEIIFSVLSGLTLAGNVVVQALPIALEAFD